MDKSGKEIEEMNGAKRTARIGGGNDDMGGANGENNEAAELKKVIKYMSEHWPSEVKEEWKVGIREYMEILPKIISDFTTEATKGRRFIRIAGVSGSGKTSQILPAVEKYCEKNEIKPVLVAARRFVKYHPYYAEILNEYGEENVRKKTDEFSTIMMFLTLNILTKAGHDIVLDVTLLDPEVEGILIRMLEEGKYLHTMLIIAVSPEVTERFLSGREWRHSKETEWEFIRATEKALNFYAKKDEEMRIIVWSVYDLLPVYDGKISGAVFKFQEYSQKTDLPKNDDTERKNAKIEYLLNLKDLL